MDINRIDEENDPDISDITIWRFLNEIGIRLFEYLQNQLASSIPEYEIQEISGIIDHLIFLRLGQGKKECFDESLFEIYQAGGYPVGWEGSYPDGKMVVFSMAGASLVE